MKARQCIVTVPSMIFSYVFFFVFVFVFVFKLARSCLITLINWPRRSEMRARQWMVTMRFLQQQRIQPATLLLNANPSSIALHIPALHCISATS